MVVWYEREDDEAPVLENTRWIWDFLFMVVISVIWRCWRTSLFVHLCHHLEGAEGLKGQIINNVRKKILRLSSFVLFWLVKVIRVFPGVLLFLRKVAQRLLSVRAVHRLVLNLYYWSCRCHILIRKKNAWNKKDRIFFCYITLDYKQSIVSPIMFEESNGKSVEYSSNSSFICRDEFRAALMSFEV